MSEEEAQPSGDVKSSPLFKKYIKMPYRDLALAMKELAADIKKLEDSTKVLKAEFDLIRLVVVPERFAEDSISSTNLTGIGRLGISADMHCSTVKEKTEAFYAWMEDNGFGDMIKPGVNSSSLKSLVKSLRESEDEDEQRQWIEIQDFLNILPFMRAALTKT